MQIRTCSGCKNKISYNPVKSKEFGCKCPPKKKQRTASFMIGMQRLLNLANCYQAGSPGFNKTRSNQNRIR